MVPYPRVEARSTTYSRFSANLVHPARLNAAAMGALATLVSARRGFSVPPTARASRRVAVPAAPPVVGQLPPRGFVLYPPRVLEKIARRPMRAEPLALIADLAVERPFRDPPHRVDERILADLFQRAEGEPA